MFYRNRSRISTVKNMKFQHLLLAAALIYSGLCTAQETNKKTTSKGTPGKASAENLVTNGNFDDADIRSLKSVAQLTTLAKPWLTPNLTSADIFAIGVKGTKAGAPTNDYGVQEPASAPAYAGFRAYTKDPKKNRTYLQTRLNKKMVKNQLYCVKMQVSLAELSKYAVNNIGAFISDRRVTKDGDIALDFTPQITSENNQPVNNMDNWVTLCGTYISNGTEEYLTIGGFGAEDKMKLEKMKKPANVTGIVMNEAYYYIDNVEVTPIDAKSQCSCGSTKVAVPDLIYSRSSAGTAELKPKEKLAAATIYYAHLSPEVPGMYQEELKNLTNIVLADPSIRIELIGHSEMDEVAEAKLDPKYNEMALKRAEKIKEYMVEAGVAEARITTTSMNADTPASTLETPMGKAQNRRVTFKLK
jgi:OmpA-OmpF porin, OOP family